MKMDDLSTKETLEKLDKEELINLYILQSIRIKEMTDICEKVQNKLDTEQEIK